MTTIKSPIAIGLCVVALAACVRTTPVAAGEAGVLEAPSAAPRGTFGLLAPPEGTDHGKRVVMVSAPQERWIYHSGPYRQMQDCTSERVEAGALYSSQHLDLYTQILLTRPDAPGAPPDRKPITHSGTAVREAQIRIAGQQAVQRVLRVATSPHGKAILQNYCDDDNIEAIQLKNGICVESDGGPQFTTRPAAHVDPDAEFER